MPSNEVESLHHRGFTSEFPEKRADHPRVKKSTPTDNLLAEGKQPFQTHFVGHVMIDNLFYQLEKLNSLPSDHLVSSEIKLRSRDYGVVTLHRPLKVDSPATLRRIVQSHEDIAARIPLIFPIHPRTKRNLEGFGISLPAFIETVGLLPHMEFVNLYKDAKLALTDSEGLKGETMALAIPCITLRKNTERPVRVSEGTNVVVVTDRQRFSEAAFRSHYAPTSRRTRPSVWYGKAADRIYAHLAPRWK